MIGSVHSWPAAENLLRIGSTLQRDLKGAHVRLVRDSNGYVSGGTVQTPSVTVRSLKRWLGFESVEDHVRSQQDPLVLATRTRFRIVSGDDVLWFNGAAWVTPVGDQWNTQVEVFGALELLTSDTISVLARLETDDPRYSPRIREMRFGFELADDYELMDDLIRNGLLPQLADVRGLARVRVESDGADSLIWADITSQFDTRYIDPLPVGAWDNTSDPNHRRNQILGFENGEVVLADPPPAGHLLEIAFSYKPMVGYTTSVEFPTNSRDSAAVPSLTISHVSQSSKSTRTGMSDFVVRRLDGLTYIVPAYRVVDIDLLIHVATDKQYDLTRLTEALTRKLNKLPRVPAPGCGLAFDCYVGDLSDDGYPNLNDLREAGVPLRIVNVALFDHEIEVKMAVNKAVFETSLQSDPDSQTTFEVK